MNNGEKPVFVTCREYFADAYLIMLMLGILL